MAANVLRSSCVSSAEAVKWLRSTEEALEIVVRCMTGEGRTAHRGKQGSRVRSCCCWIIKLCTEDIEYADKYVPMRIPTLSRCPPIA